MIKPNFKICLTLFFSGAMAVLPSAWGHHSTTMFDRDRTLTLEGSVKEIHWTNPHVAIYVDNTGSAATAEKGTWVIELTSPGNLVRSGWTRNAIKPGEQVSVIIYPLRDGTKGAALAKITVQSTGQSFKYDIRDADRPNIDQDAK